MSHPITDLSLSIKGVTISDVMLRDTLSRLDVSGFSRDEFTMTLLEAGCDLAHDSDAIRQVMQHLKRRKQIVYKAEHKSWFFVGRQNFNFAETVTLPLDPMGSGGPFPILNQETIKIAGEGFWPQFHTLFQSSLINLACLAAILALMTINASFAWEMAETELFRMAFVLGLMASDLMRPLLVARGFWELDRGHSRRGVVAIIVAFSLAPVSFLSSTSVISSALLLGVEENSQSAIRNNTLSTLQTEFERLKTQADEARKKWGAECNRGGCGKRAEKWETAALTAEKDAKKLLSKIVAMAETEDRSSTFSSRTVKAFEALHLFGNDRIMLIPILLALTLEIAALFGPALLLSRK